MPIRLKKVAEEIFLFGFFIMLFRLFICFFRQIFVKLDKLIYDMRQGGYEVKKVKLGKLFINSFKILQLIEKEMKEELSKYSFSKELEIKLECNEGTNLLRKHFFTTLMLTFLLESEIPKQRVISYGKIFLYLRQIITSVDNIIDKEDKGIIFVREMKSNEVRNSFIMLLSQELLFRECQKLDKTGESLRLILEKIYFIGKAESLRERELYGEYPKKEQILKDIHSGIGGELLKFAVDIPYFLEKRENSSVENLKKLENYTFGIYKIGMALQQIDDFFDLEEDELNDKINLFQSYIIYEKTELKELEKKYLNLAIDEAYQGFEILEKNSYPIDRSIGKKMLKKLFEIRGLKEYGDIIL